MRSLTLSALLVVGLVPSAASATSPASSTHAATLSRVDSATDLLRQGGLSASVQAAALLAEVPLPISRPATPEPVSSDVPVSLRLPVARLLGAIHSARRLLRLAIPDPEAAEVHGSEIDDLLSRALTSPPDQAALRALDSRSARIHRLVDEGLLYASAAVLTQALDDALPVLRSAGPVATGGDAGCDVVDQTPHLCIGGETSNTYTKNAALVIDLGGNDTHTHSAGGAGALDNGLPVALTIDLEGSDLYERASGVAQGAGNLGIGMLVDAAGDDTYSIAATKGTESAIGHGTNLSAGAGLLADLAGSDTYSLTSTRNDQAIATGQGRGTQPGFGILLDRGAGDDRYTVSARPKAPIETPTEVKVGGLNANGMALGGVGGVGILSDGGGTDSMTLETISATVSPEESRPITSVPLTGASGFGGGSTGGVGLMLSGPGSTTRIARSETRSPWSGIVGAAAFGWGSTGVGVLRDEGGDDTYEAHAFSHASRTVRVDDACGCSPLAESKQSLPNVGAAGVRGMGAATSGIGMLRDEGGNDRYIATSLALAEAEVYDARSSGDAGEPAEARATANPSSLDAQGSSGGGLAVLEDMGGNDHYETSSRSVAHAFAHSTSDRAVKASAISARVFGYSQGAATASGGVPGAASLRDVGGADSYRSETSSAATADPPTVVTTQEIFSSAQGSVNGNSAATLVDRDAAARDEFVLLPADPACIGTRGTDTWQDCGQGAGVGIVDDDG